MHATLTPLVFKYIARWESYFTLGRDSAVSDWEGVLLNIVPLLGIFDEVALARGGTCLGAGWCVFARRIATDSGRPEIKVRIWSRTCGIGCARARLGERRHACEAGESVARMRGASSSC